MSANSTNLSTISPDEIEVNINAVKPSASTETTNTNSTTDSDRQVIHCADGVLYADEIEESGTLLFIDHR